jgi:hypothetical protein
MEADMRTAANVEIRRSDARKSLGARFMRSSALALLLVGLLPLGKAVADVVSATPTPSTKPVPIAQPSTVSIFWSVTRSNVLNCGPTVSSSTGTVRAGNANGPVLMIVPTTLSQTQPCLQAPTNLFTFNESITVPADVVQRAQKLGVANLLFIRTFSDVVGLTATNSVNLPITGSAAAGFSVAREALQFDNGTPVSVLPRGEALHALAEIDYTGSGLFQAIWEIAGPTSTAGEPIFRPLAQVNQYLPATGEKKVLKSPALPTEASGLYLVRLRVTDPALTFEPPVIRYFVTEPKAGRQGLPQALNAYSPGPLALLAGDTKFSWEPIAGAKAYQLEVYRVARDSGRGLPDLGGADANRLDPALVARALAQAPVTGMLVPGRQTTTPISGAARLRLEPGQVYVWRVRAIGADGSIIGESAPREIRTP